MLSSRLHSLISQQVQDMFNQLKQTFFKKHMSSVELYFWCSCCVLRQYSVRLFFLRKTCDFHIETTQPRPLGLPVERFHSRGQHLCKFITTKESVYIRKEFYCQRIGLKHQHGRRDVMWKRSVIQCY